MRQFSKSRRRLATGAFLIIAGPVALGSVAYACQSLTTLHANPGSAPAGGAITLFGKNYSSASTSSNIEIRLNTRDGQVIGSFSPRSILDNVPVTIPAGTALGQHTLLATQYRADGNPVSGSPGRTTLNVTVAGRTASEGSAASAAASSSAPVAATPAAATPAAVAAPSAATATAPAATGAAASVATGTPAASVATDTAAAPAQAAATAAAPAAAATATEAGAATNVVATPASPGPAAPDAALVSVGGLLPASSTSDSMLPGLTLGAGLALVLLSLGAFLKSTRNERSETALAG